MSLTSSAAPVHSLGPDELSKIQELLLSGYWAFECLTVRDYNDMICGICGVAPKLEIAHRHSNNVLELKNVEVGQSTCSPSHSGHKVATSVCRRCAVPAVHLARGLHPGRGARGRLLADHGERGHRAGGVSHRRSHHAGGRLHHRPLHPSTDEERRCYQHREGQSPVAELSACR